MDNYNVDFFIDKFKDIPEENWGVLIYVNEHNGKKCALGHCGVREDCDTPMGMALKMLFLDHLNWGIININDGMDSQPYKQKTAKERILAALHDIKKIQEKN